MKITFPYEERPSRLLGRIKRPIARVEFWSKRLKKYLAYGLLVDTGADYTLLPHHAAFELGVNLKKDSQMFLTKGVGGKEKVYFLKRGIKIRIGHVEKVIPLGFLEKEDIPALLGREGCLNDFDVRFFRFTTTLTI